MTSHVKKRRYNPNKINGQSPAATSRHLRVMTSCSESDVKTQTNKRLIRTACWAGVRAVLDVASPRSGIWARCRAPTPRSATPHYNAGRCCPLIPRTCHPRDCGCVWGIWPWWARRLGTERANGVLQENVRWSKIKHVNFVFHLHEAKIILIAIWIAIGIVIWIAIQKMYPFTRGIHCSIQQSASHCCSLFSHCYIAIHVISGFKLSRSRSRSSVYMGKNSWSKAIVGSRPG